MDCDHPQFDSLWLYRSNTTCNHQSTIIYQIYPLIYLLCWWCWWLKNPLNASNNQSTGLERSHNFSPCHRLVGFPVWVSSKFQAPKKISNTSPSTCIPEAKKQHQSWLSQCLSLLIVPIPFIYIYYIYILYIIYIYILYIYIYILYIYIYIIYIATQCYTTKIVNTGPNMTPTQPVSPSPPGVASVKPGSRRGCRWKARGRSKPGGRRHLTERKGWYVMVFFFGWLGNPL